MEASFFSEIIHTEPIKQTLSWLTGGHELQNTLETIRTGYQVFVTNFCYAIGGSVLTATAALGIYGLFKTSPTNSKNYNPYSNNKTGVDHARVNPATGLPMVGLFDVNGNPFGHSSTSFHYESVNPANGLPMVGGVDVAGNAYGSSN